MRILPLILLLYGCTGAAPQHPFGDEFAVLQPATLESGTPAVDSFRVSKRRAFFRPSCHEGRCSKLAYPKHFYFVRPGSYVAKADCSRELKLLDGVELVKLWSSLYVFPLRLPFTSSLKKEKPTLSTVW